MVPRSTRWWVVLIPVLGAGFAACTGDDTEPATPVTGSGGDGGTSGSPGSTGSGGTTQGDGGSAGAAPEAEGGASGGASDAGMQCGGRLQLCCPGLVCDGGLSCRAGECVELDVEDFGEPCNVDAECSGRLCLPGPDDEYHCTTRCSGAGDCLAGWSCSEVEGLGGSACRCSPLAETCNGKDDDCDGTVDNASLTDSKCAATMGDGAVCDAGECACGGLLCDVLCVDEKNDRYNCGSCGNACVIACHDGECVAPVSLAVGDNRGCALISDGTVRCWEGTNESPVISTPFDLTGVVQLDLGTNHGCALLEGGTLRCWGANNFGKLGIGNALGGLTPTVVPGLNDVTRVVLGPNHTCAIRAGGVVSCWGWNARGQLGVSHETASLQKSPVEIAGLTGVADLALGYEHTCALFTDETVSCWGANDQYQLGDGTDVDRFEPQAVPSLSDVKALVAGYDHTCALLSDQTVVCWGDNELGQIGDKSNDDRDEPTPVVGAALPLSGVTEIAAGAGVTYARLENFVFAWGAGSPQVSGNFATQVYEIEQAGSTMDAKKGSLCVLTTGGAALCYGMPLPNALEVAW